MEFSFLLFASNFLDRQGWHAVQFSGGNDRTFEPHDGYVVVPLVRHFAVIFPAGLTTCGANVFQQQCKKRNFVSKVNTVLFYFFEVCVFVGNPRCRQNIFLL